VKKLATLHQEASFDQMAMKMEKLKDFHFHGVRKSIRVEWSVASHNTEMIIGLASEFIKYLRFNHFI
jgi:hypothetical protein